MRLTGRFALVMPSEISISEQIPLKNEGYAHSVRAGSGGSWLNSSS
jgi:hypothetical protein